MATVESSFERARHKMVAARIEFMSQLARFSKDELTRQPADEGAWTPLQVAYHLYLADGLALEQLRRVQNEENPQLTNVADEVPHLVPSEQLPASLDVVLAGMAARREEIFKYLAQLPSEAWERPFSTKGLGERTFSQLVNMLPIYDQQHAQQLAMLKAAQEEQHAPRD